MAASLFVSKVPNEKTFKNFEVLGNTTGKGFVGLFVLCLFVLTRNLLTIEYLNVCIVPLDDSGEPGKTHLRSSIFFPWNLSWPLERFLRFRALKQWNSFYDSNVP